VLISRKALEVAAANSTAFRMALNSAVPSEDSELLEASLPGLPPASLRHGIGDRLASFLYRLGFRKRAGCGCSARQAALNSLDFRVRFFWKRLLAKIVRAPNTGD